MKKFPDLFLQGCPCVDASLCSLCAQRLWGKAGAEVGRVTPSQGVLATVTSVGQGGGGKNQSPVWAKASPVLADCLNPTGPGRSQGAGAEAMKVGLNLVPPLVSVHPLPIPDTGTYAPEGSRAGGRCAGAAPGMDGHACGATLAHWSELQTLLLWPLSDGCPAPSIRACVPGCVPLWMCS